MPLLRWFVGPFVLDVSFPIFRTVSSTTHALCSSLGYSNDMAQIYPPSFQYVLLNWLSICSFEDFFVIDESQASGLETC